MKYRRCTAAIYCSKVFLQGNIVTAIAQLVQLSSLEQQAQPPRRATILRLNLSHGIPYKIKGLGNKNSVCSTRGIWLLKNVSGHF